MSIKPIAHQIVDQLADEATWNDLVRALYKEKKITLGMSDLEIVQTQLSDGEINSIMARLQSSSSQPSDMRNTKTYNPGNAITASWALVALAPLLFISLLLAPAAYILALLGIAFGVKALFKKERGAWLPIMVGVIELVLFVAIPVLGH
jgi:hypothetical protein